MVFGQTHIGDDCPPDLAGLDPARHLPVPQDRFKQLPVVPAGQPHNVIQFDPVDMHQLPCRALSVTIFAAMQKLDIDGLSVDDVRYLPGDDRIFVHAILPFFQSAPG
jgi:hypothetical protein